ncbi:MAG: hypothetical protein WEB19_01165 [Acidimicrobiia bacterium]
MVGEVTPVLDNRELSIALWILVALTVMLAFKGTRSSLAGLVRAATTPKIAVPLLLMLLYVGGMVAALWAIDVWTWDLVSETLFWLVVSGFVLFLAHDRMSRDPRFFRRTVVGVLSVTVMLGFVVDLYTLNFVAEFFLVPLLVMLGALLAFSATRADLVPVRGCLERAVAIAGVGLLAYSVARAVADAAGLANVDNAREFVTPVLLTGCFLPFVYAIAVYGNYDSLLKRLELLLNEEGDLYRYARRRLFLTAGVRLRTVLRSARAPWRLMVSRPSSRGEIDRVVAHIKAKKPHALGVSPAAEERIGQIATAEAPGWEYVLFAARLEAGAIALAYGHHSLDETGRAYETTRTPRKAIQIIQEDHGTAIALVEDFERIFDQDDVIRAFGAPGEPGNARRIIDLAEALIVAHDRMLQWTERARSIKAIDELAPLVQLHTALLDGPNKQVDDYIDRWIEFADELPQLLEAAEQGREPVELDMSLIITIDEDVLERFKAQAARLRPAA